MKDNGIIKIAQIMGSVAEGGVESMIMNLYKNIDKTKIQFDFILENTSKIIDKTIIEEMGGVIHIVPHYTGLFKYISELKKVLILGKYDIVHANMNALSVFPLYAAKKAGIKIRITHSHSTSHPKEKIRYLIKNILKHFSKIYSTHFFACSEKAGVWLFGKKAFEAGKVTIINNAIDINKFKFDIDVRNSMRKDLKIEDKFVIGHIGRFTIQKNHSFLLEIFANLLKRQTNCVLILVGNGPLDSEIFDKAKKLGIEDKIIFAGICSNPSKYYQIMDCFVMPSFYEGLPVVGIEAQVNGLPCLFSDTITKELKINDNIKFLSLKNDVENWCDEIKKMEINTNSRLNTFFSFINTSYDIKNEAKHLLTTYEDIIEGKS